MTAVASGTQRVAAYEPTIHASNFLRYSSSSRRLAANVVAEEVHHRLLPRGAQDRHVQRLRDERLSEVEMKDVRLREVAREGAPLNGLLAKQSLSRQVEVDVVLVGPPLLRPEDEQPRVDALAAQSVHVRPAGACEVHWEVKDSGVHGSNDTIRGLVRRVETTPVPSCS